MAEGEQVCDIRIGWVLAGLRAVWSTDPRYVDRGIPAPEVGKRLGQMARSLAFEQQAAALWRVRNLR